MQLDVYVLAKGTWDAIAATDGHDLPGVIQANPPDGNDHSGLMRFPTLLWAMDGQGGAKTALLVLINSNELAGVSHLCRTPALHDVARFVGEPSEFLTAESGSGAQLRRWHNDGWTRLNNLPQPG